VNDGLPVLSGQRLVKALERAGWQIARQRGSHVRMKHPDRRTPITVSLHRELKRGTLSGILNDAGLDPSRLRRLL
jgi:predicted RNA binding protein YcfA (HicA-like mRNA interferase family)